MAQVNKIVFRPYSITDKEDCLSIFDANCPAFFAPNERDDYARFLDADPDGYEVCVLDDEVLGAFGLVDNCEQNKSLNWILLNPHSHGHGIGSAIMGRIIDLGRASGQAFVTIAASHKSAPFFAKFGAVETATIESGWGEGMDRVDMVLQL